MKNVKKFLTGIALVATLATGILANQAAPTPEEQVADGSDTGTVTIQYRPGTTG